MDGNKLFREAAGLALIFACFFAWLSLASYSAQDPSFNQQVSAGYEIENKAGVIGSYLAGLLVEFFGLGAWLLPLFLLTAALGFLTVFLRPAWFRWLGALLLFLCLTSAMEFPWFLVNLSTGDISGGGYLGGWLWSWSQTYLHHWGALLLWSFLVLLGLLLFFRESRNGFDWFEGWDIYALVHRLKTFGQNIWYKIPFISPAKQPAGKNIKNKSQVRSKAAGNSQKKKSQNKSAVYADQESAAKAPDLLQHNYPLTELLDQVPDDSSPVHDADLQEMTEKLSASLLQFGIQGEVVQAKPGPVVTMLEFRPAPGIKISKIANLHDDLALALKAVAVRIEAPIPGKDLVGIEIPNKVRSTVHFREIIESDCFLKDKAKLPMALGQDIQGNSRVEDLASMPHLLVAGATGTGKSVGLNCILISLLFKASPQELKLLLIDPKRIEMGSYADLPHLVHPVVTEMDLAKVALDWAVKEMERRYEALAEFGVRNLESFNRKYNELLQKDPEAVQGFQPMPYLVIVIDELADLMFTAGKEAEASIVRLAQLARAAGIHLILATQRPSVDVVTGLIKANFPARIAFQVSSKHDSRTILDTVGAQYLLGQGDMLFKTGAGRLDRLHGAFISDQEINAVIDFWKQKYAFNPEVDLQQLKQESSGSNGQGSNGDIVDDPMYEQALDFVLEQGKASISMIQRHLRVGFNRAARYVEQMEKDGVIGPQDGSKPRNVIKS